MLDNGMMLFPSEALVKGYKQRRTHKKKRINKKWRKRYGVIAIPDDQIYVIDKQIFCHPSIANILRQNYERPIINDFGYLRTLY